MKNQRMVSADVARKQILRTSYSRFRRFVDTGAIRVTADGMVDAGTVVEAYHQAVSVELEFRRRVEALRDEEHRRLAEVGAKVSKTIEKERRS